MAITLQATETVETVVSYETVMTVSIILIKRAQDIEQAGFPKDYALESLAEIRSALVELEWNTKSVDSIIENVQAR